MAAGESIVRGARDALAYAHGDKKKGRATTVVEPFVRPQPLAILFAGGRGDAVNISARFAKYSGQDGTIQLSCRRPRTEIVRSMTQRRRMRAWPPPMRHRSMPSAGAAS